MTLGDKLRKLIDKKGISAYEVSIKTGISQSTLSRILNNSTSKVNIKNAEILAKYFNIDKDWLTEKHTDYETPEYLNISNEPTAVYKKMEVVKMVNEVEFMSVPLVPASAQAGYPRGFGDREYIESLPTVPIIVDKNYHGKYRVFEVNGDSMDDGLRNSICDKDKILCREVKHDLWQYKLHIRDWFFVIVHRTEGVTLKQITEHNPETGEITCHPLNPLFNDFTLNLNDIVELYNVVKIVDRNTRI